MNGKTTKKIRQSMIIQYGAFCKHCGKLPHESQLFLNRIDRDLSNDSQDNFQFLCRPCIAFRNKIERHDDLCVNNNDETAIKINRKNLPVFRKAIYKMIVDKGEIEYIDTIRSAAEVLGLSSVTTQRYMDAMISSLGHLKKEWKLGKEIVKFKTEGHKQEICREYRFYEDL